MPRDYLSEFLPDLEEFREKTLKFHRKEMSVAEYKGFSGGFGSYAERGGETHMLRLRMAGGQITKERLQFIVGICDKYHVERLKLTTCQSIQLHHLRAEDLYDMMAAAWKAGMISRGGGGDFPRNVLASPLSGVQREEYFDVLPYAQAAGDYMMGFIKAVKFPRKLKVGFSNSPANETHVTFRDLGFAATPEGTFDVYAAGGLGINPKLGVCVAKGIDPGKILYYIKAMVNTFTTYGNYENRARARTRYLQDTLGEEGLVKAYQEKLEEASATEQLDVDITVPVLSKTGPEAAVEDKRIIPQKQKGLYAVFYQPLGGSLTPAKAEELYHLIEDMEDVEIRLTPDEGLYVINCSAGEAERVLQRTADGADTLFETSTACIGNSVCQVGLRDSQALLRDCVEAVRKENFPDGVLPKIHISGCPSSCGTHQTAGIGLRGAVKQTPDGPKPAFAFFVGGCDRRGEEILAETGKSIAIEDIPRFFVELGRMVSSENTVYADWIVSNQERLDQLIQKYTA